MSRLATFVSLFVLSLLWVGAGVAGRIQDVQVQEMQIQDLHIEHDDNLYTVRFETLLNAPLQAVWRVLTDLEHLAELSPRAVESTLLAVTGDYDARLQLVLRPCILIYCKRIVKVSEVRIGEGEITYSAIPELSDFSRAEERLQLDWIENGTRLRYTAELVPAFRAPPLIGPWLIRRMLRKELTAMGVRVERRARYDADDADSVQ